MLSSTRTRAALLGVVALIGSLLLVAPAGSAEAAATTGTVRVAVYGKGADVPNVTVRLFTADWTYLGKSVVRNGMYSKRLKPGTYRLQFIDRRPAYDLEKYAPADVTVRLKAGARVNRTVQMRKGAAIYGVVRAGGKRAAGARVVAANTNQQSYEVKADRLGQYAIGGLPTGKYSVFTYDRKQRYVEKSSYIPLRLGSAKRVSPSLRTKAGRLLVDLNAGGHPLTGRHAITVVSKANGQWWTANTSGGSVSFAGLYPGRYTIIVPGVGNYFARTGTVQGAKVRSGRAAFGSFELTKRGGWVTGKVVDKGDGKTVLKGARVRLFSKTGVELGSATTDARGVYTITGQLATQGGLKLVAGPGQYTDYLKGAHNCKFASATSGAFGLQTGKQTSVGTLQLPRQAAAAQDDPLNCAAVDPAAS